MPTQLAVRDYKVFHAGAPCPHVKAIEYFEDGRIKRIEYHNRQAALTPAPVPFAQLAPPQPSATNIVPGWPGSRDRGLRMMFDGATHATVNGGS